jgi:hypothetical protein
MKKSEQILKSILLPQLEKDNHFEKLNLNDAFWEACTSGFIVYEKDAKVIYELIYALELNNAEIVIKKLSTLHNQFIKELAEMHVLGLKEEAIEKLIDNKSSEFATQVQYFQTVKGVITKLERERIKKELPIAYEKATFEIPENDLEAVIKKTERENLKKKFKQWDEEIEADEALQTVPSEKKKPIQKEVKVIRLDWLKYAVAACVIITAGIWLYQDNKSVVIPTENNIVNTEEDTINAKEKEIVPEPSTDIVYSSKTIKTRVQYPIDMGFTETSQTKHINITFRDATASVHKLKAKLIESEKENQENNNKINALKNQIKLLENQIGKYEFDEKELVIYASDVNPKIEILSEDEKTFFIKKQNKYFKIFFTKKPSNFEEVKDLNLIEKLEKINFENE